MSGLRDSLGLLLPPPALQHVRAQRGYVATGEGLPTLAALSLAGLRRQIDAHLGKDVIPRLLLDHAARLERDARRRQ